MGFFIVCATIFVFSYGLIRLKIKDDTREFNEFVDRTIPDDEEIMPF